MGKVVSRIEGGSYISYPLNLKYGNVILLNHRDLGILKIILAVRNDMKPDVCGQQQMLL